MSSKAVAAFLFFVALRVTWALLLPMSDCDEIHNYWEPAHVLLFGSGKQTWEYHPDFGLRSWFFVWLYAAPGYALLTLRDALQGALGTTVWADLDKPQLFYMTKACIVVVACLADWYFLRCLEFRFGRLASRTAFIILAFGTGFAQATGAFLPSSFAMTCLSVAAGAWMRITAIVDARELIFAARDAKSPSTAKPGGAASSKGNDTERDLVRRKATSVRGIVSAMGVELVVGIASVCAAAIVAWPFCAALAVPIALSVVGACGVLLTSTLALFISAAICAIVSAVDVHYYGNKSAFSTWNIVKYNVFGAEGRGSHLYGVEPWHFFFQNLFLNFNVAFGVALVSPAVFFFFRHRSRFLGITLRRALLHASPFYLWFCFWLRVPHKEERFFAPAYPFLTIAASTAVASLMAPSAPDSNVSSYADDDEAPQRSRRRRPFRFWQFVAVMIVWLFCMLSCARTAGLWQFYGGSEATPLKLHEYILSHRAEQKDRIVRAAGADGASLAVSTSLQHITVCMGKEWFRFPGSFFIPEPTTLLKAKRAHRPFDAFVRQYRALSPASGGSGAPSSRQELQQQDNRTVRFGFLETASFRGALPKDWLPKSAPVEDMTRHKGSAFNDLNRPNPNQFIDRPVGNCDFIFDSTLGDDAADSLRQEARDGTNWELVPELASRVLNKDATPFWCRLGFVPGFSRTCATWSNFYVLKNTQKGW